MGDIDNGSMVRVDIFKASGKWYESIAVDMGNVYEAPLIHQALKSCLEKTNWKPAESRTESNGWFAVCLEPYHKTSYPIVVWLKDK